MPEIDLTKMNQDSWGGRVVNTILVVDDNKVAAEALAKLLTADGYAVAMAHDGDTAITMAHEARPEVIVLDVNLPGKDGYEVARALRKADPNTLLIALTGYYGRKEDKEMARVAGFDHYLTRPVLASEIEKFFGGPKIK